MTLARVFHMLLPLAVLGSVAVPAQAADVILSDQVLPNDTFMHFTLKSVKDAKRQFEESPFGEFINDPVLDAFRAELENAFSGQVGKALAEVETQLGMPVDELLRIPSGEVSVSIAGVGNHIGLVIHVDIGDSVSQVESLLDLAEQALSRVSKVVQSTQDVGGVDITLYEVQELSLIHI